MRALWAMVTETPVPIPSPTVDPNLVSPGPIGFVVTGLILTPLVFFLVWDMQRRIRRVRYRDEVRAELDAEAAAQAAQVKPSTEAEAGNESAIEPEITPPAEPNQQ